MSKSLSSHSSVKLAAFGELLCRLHCPSGKRLVRTERLELSFGGAEANVCVLLSRLGMQTRFITRLPENELSLGAEDQLRGHGVEVGGILHGGHKMGLYFTESGQLVRAGKVIYDRQHSSFAEMTPGMINWGEIFADCNWFHWSGISPAVSGTVAAVCKEALTRAKEQGMTVSADFNYRSTLWKYGMHPREIMPGLLESADVLVADPDAAKTYLGLSYDSSLDLVEDRFRKFAAGMHEKLPEMKTLAMSLRGNGSNGVLTYQGALLYKGEVFCSRIQEIPFIVDRIGSGDAFTAGLIYGLTHCSKPQEIIEFATACAVLKHSIEGDFALLSLQDVLDFMETGPTSRIIR
jgi:2-dehydro-3-deoxygluconokinase